MTQATLESDAQAKAVADHKKAAQESARDLAKLIISLASAVVAISATFAEKMSQGAGPVILVLFVAWALLAASVIYGVGAMSQLVHAQWTGADKWSEWTFPRIGKSWWCFQVGMVLLLLYAAIAAGRQALRGHEPEPAASSRGVTGGRDASVPGSP